MKKGDPILIGFDEFINKEPQRPNGYLTIKELANKYDKPKRTIQDIVRRGVKTGDLDFVKILYNGHYTYFIKP